MSATEIPKIQSQIGAAYSRPFLEGRASENILRQLATELHWNYSYLMPSGSLEIEGRTSSDPSASVTIATGRSPHSQNIWNWTLYFNDGQKSDLLVGEVDVASKKPANHASLVSRNDVKQPRDYKYSWQYITTDHQGRLWDHGQVNDCQSYLGRFIESAIIRSGIRESRVPLLNHKLEALALNNQQQAKGAKRYAYEHLTQFNLIGYAGGLGVKNTAYAMPVLGKTEEARPMLDARDLPEHIQSSLTKRWDFVVRATVFTDEYYRKSRVVNIQEVTDWLSPGNQQSPAL